MMALWAAIGVLGVAAQGAVSFFYKPSWTTDHKGLDANWRRLAIYSTLVGALFILGETVVSYSFNTPNYVAAVIGVVAFTTFQSCFTDMTVFYVDAWIARVGNLIALGVAIFLLYHFGLESERVTFAVFAVLAFAVAFFPGIGNADGRALQTLVYSIYPFFILPGLKLALYGVLVALIVYYVANSIYLRSWDFKKLFTKKHFPMVPIILIPTLLVLFLGRFIPGL